MDKIVRAIGYIRISSGKSDLERQRIQINNFCSDRNYKLVDILGDIKSGADNTRKDYNELINLNISDCDVVLISEISRLSRGEVMETLIAINKLITNGLKIIFLDRPDKEYFENLNEIELIEIIFLAKGAKEERDKITYRTQTGINAKFQINPKTYSGGIIPLGYKVIDNPNYSEHNKREPRSIFAINKDEIDLLNEIYDLVIDGNTLRDISKILTLRGYKSRNGFNFSSSAISSIVRNRMNIGFNKRKGIEQHMGFQAIDNDKFNIATKKLKTNTILKNKGNVNFNPLKGIAKCLCGYNLMISKVGSNNTYMMVCGGKWLSKDKCTYGGLNRDLLFDSVWESVKIQLFSTDYIKQQSKFIKDKEKEVKRKGNDIIRLNANIKEQHKRLDIIYNSIKSTTAISLINRLEQEYLELEDQIKLNKDSVESINSDIDHINKQINKKSKDKSFFDTVTDKEKQKIYNEHLKVVHYYAINNFKGFIYIEYLNGLVNVIAIKKRYNPFQLLLPNHFKFNSENLTVSYKTNIIDKYSIGKSVTEVLTYEDIERDVNSFKDNLLHI